MKKKNVIVTIAVIVLLLLVGLIIKLQMHQKPTTYDNFPAAPTQEERDAAKKLPREKCGCWVGDNSPDAYCSPQADCI